MNLLAKKLSFKTFLKPGLMLLIPVFFGCETSEDLGVQYDLGSNANIKFQEFTLPATNIYIDSLRTDGESKVLVGNYTDGLVGSVLAEGYMSYTYESGPLPKQKDEKDQVFPDTLKLDSIVVFLEVDTKIPTQSTVSQEFSLYDLNDSLQNTAIYLSTLQLTRGDLAGTFSSPVSAAEDTVFRFKLDDAYAQTFFSNISEIAGDTTRSITTNVFKSIGLVPGPGSESIASIDLASDTTRMIMYTSPVLAIKDTTYETSFQFNGKHFSYLERNSAGSEFDGIVEFEDFNLSSGKTVIDPLAGITTAFSITDLEDFFDQNRDIIINSVVLSIEFEAENDRDTLQNFISFFRKEDDSIFGPSTASNPFGNIIMADQGYLSGQSNPALSGLNDDKDRIQVVSTLFYQQFYNSYLENGSLVYPNPIADALIAIDDFVAISPIDITLQRAVLKQNGFKLRVFFTEVDR